MPKSAEIKYIPTDFDIDDLENPLWDQASPVKIKSSWTGQRAPVKRRFAVSLLWSERGLYVRFDANQGEAPVINKFPKYDRKTIGLWDRDVCELFVAPDRENPQEYLEFEIAPTGEWVDLKIQHKDGERVTDRDYDSDMLTAAEIEYERVVMAFKVKWEALGRKPSPGDVWLGNLFRAVGRGKTRGYLAWSATRTEEPNFHVPERFGELRFVE